MLLPQNVLARLVIDRVPSVEMVRFVSSGTEACLSVLRLMRAYTKREKIIKFVGCYHGHADSFLVKAGSGVATLGLPDSPGDAEGWQKSARLQNFVEWYKMPHKCWGCIVDHAASASLADSSCLCDSASCFMFVILHLTSCLLFSDGIPWLARCACQHCSSNPDSHLQ